MKEYEDKVLERKMSKSLETRVIDLSKSDSFINCLKEWHLVSYDNKGGKCICGSNIKYRKTLINKTTGNKIEVGNDCFIRFKNGIEDSSLDSIQYMKENNHINQWEYNFLLDVMQQDTLSPKQ